MQGYAYWDDHIPPTCLTIIASLILLPDLVMKISCKNHLKYLELQINVKVQVNTTEETSQEPEICFYYRCIASHVKCTLGPYI